MIEMNGSQQLQESKQTCIQASSTHWTLFCVATTISSGQKTTHLKSPIDKYQILHVLWQIFKLIDIDLQGRQDSVTKLSELEGAGHNGSCSRGSPTNKRRAPWQLHTLPWLSLPDVAITTHQNSRMPILKQPKKREPLWREWDSKAQKEGTRAPIYSVSGDSYTGEWRNNKKDGS